MQARIETRIKGEIVMTVMCKADISDGDLATLLEDAEQDLRWNVVKDVETVYTKAGGGG